MILRIENLTLRSEQIMLMVINPEKPCSIEIKFFNGSTFTMNFPTKEDAARVYGQTYDFMIAEERSEKERQTWQHRQ